MQEVSDTASLQPSSIVDETYRIEQQVARGGFSTLYRAQHVEMGRQVALKVLALDEEVDAGALERFSQEARLACQLNHPNIVTVFEFGQDDRGLLFISMEWLGGPSLADAIEERGPLPPLRVAQIGRQVAAGLTAVHERDVLHRDLKPANVMLRELADGDEIVKLLDFGVAKSYASRDQLRITQEGKFVGTPRYAAPEQIQGGELTPRTDIYGVGLLMWEALTGGPAVSSVDFEECCARHLSEEPWEMPDEIRVPELLEEVIHRALKKSPEQRFENCRELKEALTDVIHELPTQDGSRPRSAKMESSNSSYYTITGSGWMELVFAVLVGAAVLALVGYQVWVTMYESGAPVPESAARAPSSSAVETPDDLVHALSRRDWRVERSRREGSQATRYQLSAGGHEADVVVRRSPPNHIVSDGSTVRFPTFAVRVDRSSIGDTATLYRLLGDLYQIRSGIDDDGSTTR